MKKINYLTKIALLVGIIALLAVTPLGYIPVGVIRATTIHIPVILGAILLGPKAGALLGFVFGLSSLMNNTINPTVTSFVFTPFYQVGEVGGSWLSLVVCFVPRICIGLMAFGIYRMLKTKGEGIALATAGVMASMSNTILVMGGIYLFFGEAYAAARGIAFEGLLAVIGSVIMVNGVVEAMVAGILTLFVGKVLLKINER